MRTRLPIQRRAQTQSSRPLRLEALESRLVPSADLTASLQLNGPALEGTPASFTLSVADPAGVDPQANYHFEVDWNGDGTVDDAYDGLSGLQVDHPFDNNGTYLVRLTATGPDGFTSPAAQLLVDVQNVAPTALVVVQGQAREGVPVTLTLQAADDSPVDRMAGFSYDVDFDGDGDPDNTFFGPDGLDVQYAYADDGDYTVTVVAIDQDGGRSDPFQFVLTVNNTPPTAGVEASATADVDAGTPVTFTLRATDPSTLDEAAGFTFSLDWNGDGVVDEQVFGFDGDTVQHTFASGGTYRVMVTATDKDGGVSDPATVVVQVVGLDQPPVAAVSGPASGVRGQSLQFTLTATDTPDDMAAGFAFAIDWNGDGVVDQTVRGASGTVVEHVFGQTGTFNVRVTATDQGGAVSAAAGQSVNVVVAQLQADPFDASKTVLVVGGTEGADAIVLSAGAKGLVQAWVNGRLVGTFAPTGGVAAYGYGGNDFLAVACNLAVPATLDGGDGHDVLIAGRGNSVLLGGAGHDVLIGGAGHDVLVGEGGNDLLIDLWGKNVFIGGSGQDVFVANHDALIVTGSTVHDRHEGNLRAIRAEWTSSRTPGQRQRTLLGGLLSEASVRDDGVTDLVFARMGKGTWLRTGARDLVLRW